MKINGVTKSQAVITKKMKPRFSITPVLGQLYKIKGEFGVINV